MTSEDAKAVTVRLGDHNLDDPSDAQSVEKSVKLIVKNKLFSMQTLVKKSLLLFNCFSLFRVVQIRRHIF